MEIRLLSGQILSFSIIEINWIENLVYLNLTRDKVKKKPDYVNATTVNGAFKEMSMLYNNVNWIAPL